MTKDYIKFIGGGGCYTQAGRQGGAHNIILASYCAEEHTLIHEVEFVTENSNLRLEQLNAA